MQRRLIAANWKMNKTCEETENFLSKLISISKPKHCEIIIAPPFTALSTAKSIVKNTFLNLAGQNCHFENSGAFTGEISPIMLKELGCTYTIIGHSERRHVFNEPNDLINKKILALLKAPIKPIFCIGETLAEREGNQTETVLKNQLMNGLKGLVAFDMRNVTIAYEPVWAIGT